MSEDDETEREHGETAAEKASGAGQATDEYGVGRLLALSDGVFAVAMTLLVVDIKVPPAPVNPTSQEAFLAFKQQLPNLGIYAFSFVMVAVYWLNHVDGLRTLRAASRGVLFRNLVLLGLVCLMPFVTAFFQRFSNTTAGNEVYLGALFLLGLISALTVPWRERVRRAGEGPEGARHAAAIYLDQVGDLPVFALGFLLATWIPGTAALVVLGFVVLFAVVGWILMRGIREPAPDPDRYGVGRMLALSDGVFGIALTLLVLNIAIPAVGTVDNQAHALDLLRSDHDQLVAYGITFGIVGIYWTAHHRSLRGVSSTRHSILRRNLILLFAVCLVPFVMDFFDAWSDTIFGNQFFFAAFGTIGALVSFVGPGVSRLRAGFRGGWQEARTIGSVVVASGAVPICVLGILLTPVLGPGSAQLVWLLMIPLVAVERKWSANRTPAERR
jgi:uncharacterized membrane protein